MTSSLSLRIDNSCIRSCDHCFNESTKNGEKMPFDDIEDLLDQFVEFSLPQSLDLSDKYIELTGGDILLYSWNGKHLGDVIDAIHRRNLIVASTTRGFTDQEKANNHLIYTNFKEAADKLSPLKEGMHISFDTYTHTSKGDHELAMQMARNMITELRERNLQLSVLSTTSVERMERTYNAIIQLTRSLDYHPTEPSWNELDSKEASDKLIQDFRTSEYPVGIIFKNEQLGHKFEWLIQSVGILGRAEGLNETPLYYPSRCGRVDSFDTIYINPDLSVSPCGNYNRKAFDSLRELSLKEIVDDRVPLYLQEIKKIEGEVSFIDIHVYESYGICDVCPKMLEKSFLNQSR